MLMILLCIILSFIHINKTIRGSHTLLCIFVLLYPSHCHIPLHTHTCMLLDSAITLHQFNLHSLLDNGKKLMKLEASSVVFLPVCSPLLQHT